MSARFTPPDVALPGPIQLPAIERSTLANGLRVWTVRHGALPVVATTLIIDSGTADDPALAPGLAALTADLLDEGAGGRDAIQFAEILAGLGAAMEMQAGPDATSVQMWMPVRHAAAGIGLLADVVARPQFRDADLSRVRELRLSRLQQLSRSAPAVAERAFRSAVFGAHGYGHPGWGTTASLSRISLGDVRSHYAQYVEPGRATLIAVGDVSHAAVADAADAAFGNWEPPSVMTAASANTAPLPVRSPARVLFVERTGAPQSEIRIGHLGVPRSTPDYHAVVLFNSCFGGSFSGRLNQRLRQQLGHTYGARSAFDMDRLSGTFACETSVQGDKTFDCVREIIEMATRLRGAQPLVLDRGAQPHVLDRGVQPLSDAELELARGSLTRGYARHFETPRQMAGALAQLVVYGLPDDTFDRFVPALLATSAAEAQAAAERHLHPDDFVVVVVGDPARRDELAALGLPIDTVTPEF